MPFSRLIPVDTWGVWGHSHWHVFVSLHTRTMNTAEDSTQHSPSQNNLLHRDGQQNLQPCPETALPVLSPGQSIAAEFGASSRGRKRARRISPTRQKTREGILEWKEERTERSYNKTQAETQTVRTLVIFSIEMQLQKSLLPDYKTTLQDRSGFQCLQGHCCLLQKATQRACTASHRLIYPDVSSTCR